MRKLKLERAKKVSCGCTMSVRSGFEWALAISCFTLLYIRIPVTVVKLLSHVRAKGSDTLIHWIWVLIGNVYCVDNNKLWKILKEMGIPDHFTCFLRNLYAGQEATVITRHGTMDWFKIGKGVCQEYILSSCLFNLHAEHIMQNALLDEA